MADTSGTDLAVVSFWKSEEGWGELVLPNGTKCFGHFSLIQEPGFRALEKGQSVTVDWRMAQQDEYSVVATAIYVSE